LGLLDGLADARGHAHDLELVATVQEVGQALPVQTDVCDNQHFDHLAPSMLTASEPARIARCKAPFRN
jgi:hypothetical protein